MKKKFVKVSLFCALAATASTAFVACADYDDDIKNLQEQVDANKTLAETLDAQIQDLKKAQETANAEIQAAKDAAAAAQEAADKANELAKQAAAEAKAEAIEEATKLVEALKADIEAKNYATTEELNAAITSVNSKIASIEEGLNGKIDGINSTIEGLDGRVSEAEKLIEELKTQKLAVETFEQYKKDAALEVDEKIADLKETLDKAIADAEQNAKTYTDEQIKALKADLEKQINAVNVNLITLLGETLRSLVFVPNLYVDGIEAAEYGYLFANLKEKAAAAQSGSTPGSDGTPDAFTIDGTFTEGISHDYVYDATPKTTEYDPIVYVDYHMNPSSAKVEESGLSFTDREVEVISRAAGSGKVNYAAGTAKSENGVLTVGLTAKGSAISSQHDATIEHDVTTGTSDGENDATIFALQSKVNVEGKDTVITSDYAMLYASRIEPLAIAFTKESGITTLQKNYDSEAITSKDQIETCPGIKDGDNNQELYVKPVYAGKEGVDGALRLEYDDKTGINLLEKLCLHYAWHSNTSKGTGTKHAVMSVQEAKDKYGMQFEFNLVNFLVGAKNKTSDSKFLDPNKIKDGVAVACIVKNNEDGTGTSLPGEQGVSSIGRHPLVQVLVRDNAGKILLDGYIKLEIVRENENKVCDHTDFGTVNFGCSGATLKQSWDEVSYKLYELAAVSSKEEFEALYALKMTTGNTEAVQYSFDGTKFEPLANYIGKVTRVVDKNPGTTTNVLQWELSKCNLETVYHSKADAGRFDGSQDNAKTIYVCYALKSASDASDKTYGAIFVPLTVHVAKPQATVGSHIAEYWYNDGMNTWFKDYSEGVHVNVKQPEDHTNTINDPDGFVYDFYSAWVGNKISIKDLAAGFDGYDATAMEENFDLNPTDNAASHTFYFRAENEGKTIKGVSGTEYVFHVASTELFNACNIGVAYANPEYTTAFEKNNAIDGTRGVYTNKILQAAVVGTTNYVTVAEIVEESGAPRLVIAQNDFAKDILNAYGHSEPESWTTLVGIAAVNDCGIVLSLTNNVYPARIQRPVDIVGSEDAEFIDAHANGSVVDLIDLIKCNDWREVDFVKDGDITNAWLFAYYGFKSADVDIDNITTTMNGGELGKTLLSSVSKDVKFSHVGKSMKFSNVSAANYKAIYDKVRDSLGQIRYDNNRGNVQEFMVRIPVDINYDWGTIRVEIDAKVKPTIGN